VGTVCGRAKKSATTAGLVSFDSPHGDGNPQPSFRIIEVRGAAALAKGTVVGGKLSQEIARCYRNASECQHQALQAHNRELQQKHLYLERRWLFMARGYEFTQQLSELGRNRRPSRMAGWWRGAVARCSLIPHGRTGEHQRRGAPGEIGGNTGQPRGQRTENQTEEK
jgi:hypothetical protein